MLDSLLDLNQFSNSELERLSHITRIFSISSECTFSYEPSNFIIKVFFRDDYFSIILSKTYEPISMNTYFTVSTIDTYDDSFELCNCFTNLEPALAKLECVCRDYLLSCQEAAQVH